MPEVTVQNERFLRDGEPIQILSGAIHYFRVVPQYWRDRLLRLRAMGLNTIETYVPWNLHEPYPGRFRFSGALDIVQFIQLAAELDLMVIVRPGPYICSEWDLGGLPSWLLRDPCMQLRCMNRPYLQAVDRYWDRLIPLLTPFQCTSNGPIIAMQVENEYGSYGSDTEYLEYLRDGLRRRGVSCLLFTSDGPCDTMLQGGTISDTLATVNFGSESAHSFNKLREYRPDSPLMCGEFWCGWFDHWGEAHHTRDANDAAQELERILSVGASVNIYMAHGGSTPGFLAAANHDGTTYQPDVSSYDSDAPVDEHGGLTPKYHAMREVLLRYTSLPPVDPPAPLVCQSYGRVPMSQCAVLMDNLDALTHPVRNKTPLTMEQLRQSYGFVLYRTHLNGPQDRLRLTIDGVGDRALVFLDGVYLGVIDRNGETLPSPLDIGPGVHQLDILVENMGRINYGPLLQYDRKGIKSGVRLGYQYLYDWTMYPLPMDRLSALRFESQMRSHGPAFYRGSFSVKTPTDTFLALPGWTKGVAWINGYNLGRYWPEAGPQRTHYIPAPLLKRGQNTILLFELHAAGSCAILQDTPDLG